MGLTPETLMQLGLYDYVWGDNWYPKAMQAADEAEKNREAQRAYNDYLKEYDRAKAEAEKSAAYKKELKEAEVEMAALNRDLVKAKPTDAAVILKRQDALVAKYPELKSIDTSTAQKAYNDEREYAANLNRFKGQVKRNFLHDDDIKKEIDRVQGESWIRPEDSSDIVKDLQSQKSLDRMIQERNLQQDLNRGGEKRGKALDVKDILDNSKKPSYVPSSSDKTTMKAAGWFWDKGKQAYIKGAK